MTAEERVAEFVRAWESEGVPRGGLAVALASAVRGAEAAVEARYREALAPFAAVAGAMSDYARAHPEFVYAAFVSHDPYRVEARVTGADLLRAAEVLSGARKQG